MKRLATLTALAFTLTTHISLAEAQQPYAGFNTRSIKALSDQQIAD